eukprot:g3220.t1
MELFLSASGGAGDDKRTKEIRTAVLADRWARVPAKGMGGRRGSATADARGPHERGVAVEEAAAAAAAAVLGAERAHAQAEAEAKAHADALGVAGVRGKAAVESEFERLQRNRELGVRLAREKEGVLRALEEKSPEKKMDMMQKMQRELERDKRRRQRDSRGSQAAY